MNLWTWIQWYSGYFPRMFRSDTFNPAGRPKDIEGKFEKKNFSKVVEKESPFVYFMFCKCRNFSFEHQSIRLTLASQTTFIV